MKIYSWRLILASFLSFIAGSSYAYEFTPDSKDASTFTTKKNKGVIEELPFNNKEDFENVNKGFIAPLPDNGLIKDGNTKIWDASQFDFVNETDAPATANPSLWRQTRLMTKHGLFEVAKGVYQIRSADLSNMTIVEGKTGLIIIDTLTNRQTAAAALKLFYDQTKSTKPVKNVIYTHSHVDHFGGVLGVIKEEDVGRGVGVYAPRGFVEEALSENVFAGNNMARRALYSYGSFLNIAADGNVSAGLGLTIPKGEVTFATPTHIVEEDTETINIDGIKFIFVNVPGTEAPAEMMIYMPEQKILNPAEDCTHTMHNIYTLRGAKVRNAHAWAEALDTAIQKFPEAEILIAQHHWPTWGNEKVMQQLESQRDLYKYLHDQTLRYANKGYNMYEAAEMMSLPKSLSHVWANRGYYGSVSHNTKAVWNFYLGFFNSNPANLNPLPVVESAKKYVEYMGGADAILERATDEFKQGNYRWVATVVNYIVQADPSNMNARYLLADAFEQMGYQTENGTWRNHYLMGAKELRSKERVSVPPKTISKSIINAIPSDMLFDYLAVRLNGPAADGKQIRIGIVFPDIKEEHILFLKNSVLHNFKGDTSKNTDGVLTLNRSTFDNVIVGNITLKDAVKNGDVIVTGDRKAIKNLLLLLDKFDPNWPIVTPRKMEPARKGT